MFPPFVAADFGLHLLTAPARAQDIAALSEARCSAIVALRLEDGRTVTVVRP